jgi:hypothetical protein
LKSLILVIFCEMEGRLRDGKPTSLHNEYVLEFIDDSPAEFDKKAGVNCLPS